MTTPRFGVNYVPRQGWFHSWLEPDLDATRRDLEAIAALGLDHVRIFPFWPVLQPNRTLIRSRALADVRSVVEAAGEMGLDASVDVIQGHMSSFDFLPAWLTSWHATNMFTDAGALRAQAELTRSLHEAVADLPNYVGLTLGNEVNQFSGDPHPAPMRATPEQAETWIRTLLQAVPEDGKGVRLHAEYDAVWYLDDHPFEPAHASRLGDVTAIHSWIFNGTAQRYGALSAESVRHAEYLTELSRAFATDPARPVWLQEIGAPLNCLEPGEEPEFCQRAVQHLADSAALWGVTWWCSHDVDRSLADFPELEYSLGLFDAEGRVKPLGRAFAEVATDVRQRQHRPPERSEAVVVPVDAQDVPLRRADLAPGGSVFTAWMELASAGKRPTVITSTTAASARDLASRGITAQHHAAGVGESAYSAVSDAEALAAGAR